MAKTKPRGPRTARRDNLGRGVLGVTREGIRILQQPDSEHFTQEEALEAVRRVIAARAPRISDLSDESAAAPEKGSRRDLLDAPAHGES